MGLSSSTMNDGTISAGAEQALGPNLVSDIVEMAKGNKDALQFVNMIEHLPKNSVPVDDNLVDFLNDNAEAIIQEIRDTTGLDGDIISSHDILVAAKAARKFGIAAIPYVVGIVATVAAGNPVAGVEAGKAADKAVDIANKIENAMYNIASQTKTPVFLKKLSSSLSNGKVMIKNVLNKIWSRQKSGAYETLKMRYGKKNGACDCDKIGSAEEDVGLMAAREYLKTSSSAAKINLAKDINNAISKYIQKAPPAGLTEIETANWLMSNMIGSKNSDVTISLDKLDSAVNALVKILNSFLGKEYISTSLSKEAKAVQVAEMLHALTTGMHLEFLVVQQDIHTIEQNLDYLGQLEQDMTKKIIDKSQPDMSEVEKVELLVVKDALRLISSEMSHQVSLIKGLTTGTITESDKKILELIANGSVLKMEIDDISDKNPSNESFQQVLYKLVNMTVLTGATAAFIENALKEVGLRVDDYKKMSNLGDLRDAVAKLSPKSIEDVNKITRFTDAVEILEKNFNRRSEIKTGSREYPRSEVSKKIDAAKNLRAIQLRTFANQLVTVKKDIENAINGIIPFAGESIPYGNELDVFVSRLEYLYEDRVTKGKTYEALAGAIKDPLALQVRGEILGNYKMLKEATMSLMSVSSSPGKDALVKFNEAIDQLIKLSDSSNDSFSKIIGSADITASLNPATGVSLSNLDLKKVIDKIKAAVQVTKVRENIKGIMSNFKGVTPDYEQMVGKSIAGVLNDINIYQKMMLENVSGDSEISTFIISQCESMRNIWKSAEAIDYFLGNFTHDIRLSASEINDISALMEDVTVSRDTYDSKLGNLFTSVFDCFPGTIAMGAPIYPNGEVLNNDGSKHYYELFEKQLPGNPAFAADPKNGLEAVKRARLFTSKFATFKNIVNIFYSLGAKYGKDKAKDSLKYVQPQSLLKSIMDYVSYGSFMVVDPTTSANIDALVTKINAAFSGGQNILTITEKDLLNEIKITKAVADMDKECKKLMNLSLLNFHKHVKDRIFSGGIKADQEYDATITDNPDPKITSIFLRSEMSDYLRGDPVLVKTDEIFTCLIKSMLAKILACVETFEIMKKPMNYNVHNSGVRQILGGASKADIKPEYIDLYIRLPLLVRFYKEIFNMNNSTGFSEYQNLDKSASKSLKISILPDIDGIYGPLVKYLFSNDKIGISSFTDSQMAVTIDKINVIINSTPGSDSKEKIKNVIQGFIREVNRRFSIVTQEDNDDYKKLMDEEYNLWGSVNQNMANNYNDDLSLIGIQTDELSTAFNLPSSAYVNTTSTPGGIFGSSRRDFKVDTKFYGEYYTLYKRFRSALDTYISDNTASPLPDIRGAINTLQIAINNEPMMNKKLEMLSNFITSGVNLNDYSKAKYVAFHEFIVSGINALSVADSYITNIISLAYVMDPLGLGNALINQGGNAAIDISDVVPLLKSETLVLNAGISDKAILKFLEKMNQTAEARPANMSDLKNNSGQNKSFRANEHIKVLGHFLINTLYGLSNNDLFDIKVTENGVGIDYDKFKDTVESLYAAVKSSMEKFRPFIDPAFYELYVGIISDNNDKGGVYEIYHDLIRIKLNGTRVLSSANDLDVHLGNYYGIGRAIAIFNDYIKLLKKDDDIKKYIIDSIVYPIAQYNGIDDNTPKMTDWYIGTGSSIEKLHVFTDGTKSEMDLRFAGRYRKFYDLDGHFKMFDNIFLSMGELLARFLGRTYDASIEKVYRGVINPFEKMFSSEITDPFKNGFPDIWPAVFMNKKKLALPVVTDKDSYVVDQTLAASGAVNDNHVSLINDVSKTLSIFSASDAPNDPKDAARDLPDYNRMLFASLANIIRNVKRNKNATGLLANMAESLSEISETTKERLREEIPLFKKYFNELSNRARFLLEFVSHHMLLDSNIPEIGYRVFPSKIGKPRETSINSYLSKLLARVADIGDTFEKACDDISKELTISHEYGELFPGFIKTYQAKYGILPFVPLSTIFAYPYNRHLMDHEREDFNVQLIPCTKSMTARYLTNFVLGAHKVSSSPIVDMLIKKFDDAIQGPERLKKEDIKNIIEGYTKLMLYFGDARLYKSYFARPGYDATTLKRTNEMIYPEDFNGVDYTPQKEVIVTPWTISPLVNSSRNKNYGIIVSKRSGNNAFYVNNIFFTKGADTVIGTISLNDPNEQLERINSIFGITEKNFDMTVNNFTVSNILDLNIVPIDFSEFSRFIPLSNLMNYSYTLDFMSLDILVKDSSLRNEIKKSIIKSGEIPITTSESMIHALLVNPFGVINGKIAESLEMDNMFKGISQLKLGRPKFLSDQMYGKALFGELYSSRKTYTEDAHEYRRMTTFGDSFHSTTTEKTKMPVIRGSGENSADRRNATGFEMATELLDQWAKLISAALNGAKVDIKGSNLSKYGESNMSINIAGKDIPIFSYIGLYDDSLKNVSAALSQNTNATDTDIVINVNGALTNVTLAGFAIAANTTINVPAFGGNIKISDSYLRSKAEKFVTKAVADYTAFEQEVLKSIDDEIIEIIQNKKYAPTTKVAEMKLTDLPAFALRLLKSTLDPLDKMFMLFKSDLASFGSMGYNSNNDNVKFWMAYLWMDESRADAEKDSKAYPNGGVLNTEELVREYFTKNILPGLKGGSVPNAFSRYALASTGRKQGSIVHPIYGYFASGTGFQESYAGQMVDSRQRADDMNFIDPRREGISRIRSTPVHSRKALRDVGTIRLNTMYCRFFLFIVNAYRLVLYRLREDAKNPQNRIANAVHDIIDEDNTEFYGFDMIE